MWESPGGSTVFRVLARATGLLVIAPPERVPTRLPASRRVDGRASGQPGATAHRKPLAAQLTPLAMAPWGEPARSVPYVVITTQAWPHEWWRPADRVATVSAARPISVVAARRAPGGSIVPVIPAKDLPASSVAGAPTDGDHAVAERAAAALGMAPPAASPAAHTSLAHGRGRSQRGLMRRVAILVIGLVVSIVAAETAYRVGRR